MKVQCLEINTQNCVSDRGTRFGTATKFFLGCLPQWGGILVCLSYLREGALEKGERREYNRRGTEVSLGHNCTGKGQGSSCIWVEPKDRLRFLISSGISRDSSGKTGDRS
jgi:hypothetical protein